MFQREPNRSALPRFISSASVFALACAIWVGLTGSADAQHRYDPFTVPVQSPDAGEPQTRHLGTFRIEASPLRGDARDAETPSSTHSFDDEPIVEPADRRPLAPEFEGVASQDLLQTFADARAAQAEGDEARAQRLFERVIATQPNGRLADAARRDLAKLYGAALDQPESSNADDLSPPQRETAQPLTNRTARQPKVAARAPIAIPRSRRVVMLERQFIADVGDRVFFAGGRAELGARARDVIESQAQWLTAHPDLSVIVQGHADDGTAPRRAQDDLSLKRAEAVRQLLIANGISAQRVRTEAFGQSRPVADCRSESCQAQNRRVVTLIEDRPVQTAKDGGTRTTGRLTDGRATEASPRDPAQPASAGAPSRN